MFPAFEREWRGGAPGRSDRHRALSRIEGNELIVAAPRVERETPSCSHRARLSSASGRMLVDRGWRGLDPAERDRLRQSVRANADNERPRELPARPQTPRTAWAARGTPPAVAPADSERTPARSGRRIDDAQPRNASEAECSTSSAAGCRALSNRLPELIPTERRNRRTVSPATPRPPKARGSFADACPRVWRPYRMPSGALETRRREG